MAIQKLNFSGSNYTSPAQAISKDLMSFGSSMIDRADKEELLKKQEARQATEDAWNQKLRGRIDEKYAREQQDLAASDIYRRVVGGENQHKAGLVTDEYNAGNLRIPEMSGEGIQSNEERNNYLNELVAGRVDKRAAPVMTPKQQLAEDNQAKWSNEIMSKDAFKETELDKLDRSFSAIENAGYKVPSNLLDLQQQAKATYQKQAETDRKSLETKLAAYDKEKAGLIVKKGASEDKFAKNKKSGTGTSTGTGVITALDSMYKTYGSPDWVGTGDQAKIEQKLMQFQALGFSDKQMQNAINQARGDYKDKFLGVGEEEFTSKVKSVLSTMSPKTSINKTSKEADAIDTRLAQIEASRKAAMAASGTPEEKRAAIMQESLKPYQSLRNDVNTVVGNNVVNPIVGSNNTANEYVNENDPNIVGKEATDVFSRYNKNGGDTGLTRTAEDGTQYKMVPTTIRSAKDTLATDVDDIKMMYERGYLNDQVLVYDPATKSTRTFGSTDSVPPHLKSNIVDPVEYITKNSKYKKEDISSPSTYKVDTSKYGKFTYENIEEDSISDTKDGFKSLSMDDLNELKTVLSKEDDKYVYEDLIAEIDSRNSTKGIDKTTKIEINSMRDLAEAVGLDPDKSVLKTIDDFVIKHTYKKDGTIDKAGTAKIIAAMGGVAMAPALARAFFSRGMLSRAELEAVFSNAGRKHMVGNTSVRSMLNKVRNPVDVFGKPVVTKAPSYLNVLNKKDPIQEILKRVIK